MNKEILHPDVQEFIGKNINADIRVISLSKSPFSAVSPRELAEQINSKQRCEQKLPLWFHTKGIYYPPRVSVEQASSEETANYKAGLIRGNSVIDLTGGMGVDSYYFSRRAEDVTYCEINIDLCEITEHNSKMLGSRIRHLNRDGIEYLAETDERFSTIYLDPSRRKGAEKVFMLKDCEPDVVAHMDLLRSKSDRILVKTAPLLDIQAAISEIQGVTEVHVVSVRNECKELLLLIEGQDTSEDPLITCAALGKSKQSYSFSFRDEKEFRLTDFRFPGRYIYEPDVALLKAGCFKLITRDFELHKLNVNTHLYTSDKVREDFPGRIFEADQVLEYRTILKQKSSLKANVICRNFPLSPEQLKRKLKLKDGGDQYLLFCTGPANELLVVQAQRIQ